MGFKFGKCKKLTTLREQALANTSPDFIDFEGCDELTTLRGTNASDKYGALYNTKAVTVSFKNCAKLTTIGSHMLHMESGVVSNLETIDFTGCTGLKTIGSYFLSNSESIHSDSITKIDLSPCINLESIGNWFAGYSANLEEVDMHGLSKLNDTGIIFATAHTLFECCSKLTKVDITGCTALEKISSAAFKSTKIETLIGWDTEKSHIKEIGPLSFTNAGLVNIDISNMPELTTIHQRAFQGCGSMKTCPNNCPKLQSIGLQAFYGCTNLGLNEDGTHSTLDLSNNTNLTTIDTSAFEGVKAIETINLDNDTSLASLGNSCFKGNTALKHFYARNCISLASIGSLMFNGSSILEDVYFNGCPQLTVIPVSIFKDLQTTFWMADFEDSPIVEIGASAFQNCKKLKTFKFTNGKLKKIGKQAFEYINRADIDQIDFEMDQCNLLDSYAFSESTIIKSLTVANGGSATYIGEKAFYKCPNLLTVSITNVPTITTIKPQAFYQSPQLTSIDLSNCTGLTLIDNNVCNSDYKLTTFKIQDSPLQSIGQFAFINCVRLEAFDADSSKFSDHTWTAGSEEEKNSSAINIQAFEFCTSMKTFKIHIDPDNDCHLMRSAFAGWRNEASGVTPPTYPLDVYIYGSVPPSVPAHGTNFINGANNNACQFTIHLSSAAEAAYKAAAALEEGVATDGRQFYWCCSDGSAKTATHNTGYWYGNPGSSYEDFKLPTIVFDL